VMKVEEIANAAWKNSNKMFFPGESDKE